MNPIEIRKGKIKDIPDLKLLLQESIAHLCKPDYSDLQIAAWIAASENSQRWEDVFQEEMVWIAVSDDLIVGFIAIAEGNFIDLLFTHKDFQNQGIATQLLHAVELMKNPMHELHIKANASITALPFFLKNGFKVIQKQDVELNGVNFNNYQMEKKIP